MKKLGLSMLTVAKASTHFAFHNRRTLKIKDIRVEFLDEQQ